MAIKEFDSDTIAAIATPLGEGGIGVVRVSGRDALRVADAVFEPQSRRPVREQKSWTAQLGRVRSADGRTIDEAVVLVMRAPKSYTAEDVVEFSVHGGAAALRSTLERVIAAGARLAQKGEFTKRAFLNGRIDLLQAEAVLDLVSAKTDLARQWAAAQLEGALTTKAKAFKNTLMETLAHLEAAVDFPDDEPDTAPVAELARHLERVALDLRELLHSSELGFIAKKGARAALAGRPNVGKSSLMNALSGLDRVIVTPYPGTTRDVVEEEIELRGFPIRLLDTAGIQDTEHPIEKKGIERTKAAVSGAELVLYVVDGSAPLHADDLELLKGLGDKKAILVVNKSDLPSRIDLSGLSGIFDPDRIARTSCVNRGGLRELEEKIVRYLVGDGLQPSDGAVVSTVRQKEAIEKCLESVERAEQACRSGLSPELIAVDVRQALDRLGSLVGEVVTDEVLDLLFSRFCIGK